MLQTEDQAVYSASFYHAGGRFLVQKLMIEGDSQLVLLQVDGTYKVRAANLMPLHKRVMSALRSFDEWRISHIDRSLNARADALANEAMDTQQSRQEGVGVDVH